MAVKFIQDVLDEKAQSSTEKTLIQVLIKNMGRYYPERSHEVIHASDVTKPEFCARKFRLLDHTGVKQSDSYISAALRATFDIGSMVADKLVEDWIGSYAQGHWQCSRCGLKSSFGIQPDKACTAGIGKCKWKYQEVRFLSESTHIDGSIDLLADLGGPKLKVVELKTIKPDDFDKLAAPLAEHRLRTRLYLKIIEDSTNPIRLRLDTQSAKILYVSKGFGKMHPDYGQIVPFKEFDVQRDDESIAEYIQHGLDVKLHRETKTIPIKKVCPSVACPTAKSCPVKAQCWGGLY